MTGLSIPQKGNFMGLSIELSVANQYLGRNSTRLNVPFLNYLATLRSRMGMSPLVRVGGNSQEHTELFYEPFNSHMEITNKTLNQDPNSPTITPEVNVWIDLLYTLLNITQFTGTQWYLGLPYGYPLNVSGIVEMTLAYEQALGDNLIALQLGNEPDLYWVNNRDRPDNYPVSEYIPEFGTVVSAMKSGGVTRQDILLAPSVCCNVDPKDNPWSIEDILNGGLLTDYSDSVAYLAVQRYPYPNCGEGYQADVIFPQYLMHNMSTNSLSGGDYAFAAATAVTQNKPLIMFETNTASCGGFPGLSDSFGAALWSVDWTMQLAYRNFSGAMFHFGGQNASYNAFTPPPSDWSFAYQWTTGPVFYSMLMVAEALGSSNVSQVIDLQLNDNSLYTPGYAIYENGQPARVLLINFIDDGGTGTAAYTGYIHIGGTSGLADTTPTTVTVRYLSSPSVTEKYNITYGGQSMGGAMFESDGRIQGEQQTETVQCSADTGCPIRVPAPGAALVFMSQQAQDESYDSALVATYSTSYFSEGGPTVDSQVLATSNGRGGPDEKQHPLGSTSKGKADGEDSAATKLAVSSLILASAAMLAGAMLVRH
ncbi:hypothetical protein DL93DRAFT_1730126 [Clavulina sp. PMI_390]|nr:hypothetical protein DL93DRAFT_1730126 [Clavulina sp. PMI_390]